jgi:hypothetical protein
VSNVYEVIVGENSLGFFEADSKPAARVAAIKPVKVRLVDSGEVIKLMREGVKIHGADEDAGSDEQQSLQLGATDPEPDSEDDSDRELGG